MKNNTTKGFKILNQSYNNENLIYQIIPTSITRKINPDKLYNNHKNNKIYTKMCTNKSLIMKKSIIINLRYLVKQYKTKHLPKMMRQNRITMNKIMKVNFKIINLQNKI